MQVCVNDMMNECDDDCDVSDGGMPSTMLMLMMMKCQGAFTMWITLGHQIV